MAARTRVSHADSAAIEFAWRVHQEIIDWTGKVDTKAAIILPFESAVLGLVVSLSGKNEVFAHLAGWRLWLYRGGSAALIGAILCSALVIMPQLTRRLIRREPSHDLIYFGSLRRLRGDQLLTRLRDAPAGELAMLSNQLITASAICWRKHARLQSSIVLLLTGAALLGVICIV
jgi:hypothetical protein